MYKNLYPPRRGEIAAGFGSVGVGVLGFRFLECGDGECARIATDVVGIRDREIFGWTVLLVSFAAARLDESVIFGYWCHDAIRRGCDCNHKHKNVYGLVSRRCRSDGSGFVQTREYMNRRQFVQTFFFVPKENGYFIVNDIFRFVNEESSSHQPAVHLTPQSIFSDPIFSNHHLEPVLPMTDGGIQGGQFRSTLHPDQHVDYGTYNCIQSEFSMFDVINNLLEDEIAEPTLYPYMMGTTEDLSSFMAEELPTQPIKHTYASILQIPKVEICKSFPPQSCALRITPLASAVPDKNNDEVTSVYVKNLTHSATAANIEEKFQYFGSIEVNGIFIKYSKDSRPCFAFVKFEDIHGAQNAIAASPILFNGRKIKVEKCRSPCNGPSSERKKTSRRRSGEQAYRRVKKQENAMPTGNVLHRSGSNLHRGRKN